ncbi:MAG: OprO/OprP family phosphate-selective porin [Candidatus Berkiellales bacterium]
MSKMTNNKLALLALAGLSAVASGPAFAAGSMTVDSDGGIEVFNVEDKNFWFKLGGRLFIDQAWYDEGDDNNSVTNFPDGSDIRSARVTFKGGVGDKWVYKLDFDFIDAVGNGGNSKFGEAFIGYNFCDNIWGAVGQVSIPFGLENWASASDLSTMELSMPSDAFAPDYGIGLYGEWHGRMFTAAGALYNPRSGIGQSGDVLPAVIGAPGSGPNGSAPGSDPWAVAGRITFSPVHDDVTVYHAGLSGRYQRLHQYANDVNFTAGMEVRNRESPNITTNIPPNSSQSYQVWGGELAARSGPFILQGEYMWVNVKRPDFFPTDPTIPGGSQDYRGYYILASYVLTGETKEYDFDSGTFGTVTPKSKKGAWEVVARYDFIDLVDNQAIAKTPIFTQVVPDNPGSFTTGLFPEDLVGSAHNGTLGVTWYVNENVRFLANYVRADLPNDNDINVFGVRGQVVW